MDTKTFISKADLLKEVRERGLKNMTAMRKAEIASRLGITLAPRPKLSPDEKRIKSRAYARKHYRKKKATSRPPPPPHPSTTCVYIHNVFMYMIIIVLFAINNALMSL